MSQEPLEELLRRHMVKEGIPLRMYIINTGGTITSVVNEKGHLEPATSEDLLSHLILDMLGFSDYVKSGILDLNINFLFSIDSSQMRNIDRQRIVSELRENYARYDGAIILHGTDTGDSTAKFVHLALPYYDPIALWHGQDKVPNFCKPVAIVSSQIPLLNEKGNLRIDSDGLMSLAVAANLIAQGAVGEAGILANYLELIPGTASTKGSETEIPQYLLDKGVPPIGRYASDGIHYTVGAYLPKKADENKKPLSLENVTPLENKILVVFEPHHLNSLKDYFRAKDSGNSEIEKFLRETLPEMIIYVSKGDGNVDGNNDYPILDRTVRELDLSVFRVPIPGGRISKKQVYEVPGHELPAVNMQPKTAEYKAMMTLSLADRLGIEPARRKEFVEYMMTKQWSNELLPQRFTI